MVYYSAIMLCKWDRSIQEQSIWLKIPASGGCGKNGAQPVLQANIATCFRGMQKSGIWGRREKKIPRPNQPKHHKQTKNPPFSVQTEWAACIISVTSVCDRNSSVVQSSVPLAMFLWVLELFAAGWQIPSFSSVLMYIC